MATNTLASARPAIKLNLCSAAITAGLSDKNVSYNSVKMTQKLCFLMVHTAGTWGLKYKTLRSACEVLVVKNKMGEQNKRLSNQKHITSPSSSNSNCVIGRCFLYDVLFGLIGQIEHHIESNGLYHS